MSVKACRFLIDVSLRWDESGHTMHIPLSQLQCILLAQGSHKATFPQAFPKPGPEVEEGALLFPTSPLSTLTCGWGLSTHWISGIMKSTEELAQFGTAPDIPPKLCTCPLTCWELLWASAAPEICCLPYRDQNWLSFMTQNKSLLRKRCLVEESLFAVFLFNEIMHKTYEIYLCYWWNFDENWNHTRINLIVFSLKFDIYFLDPVIDNHSYSTV